MFTGLIEEIGSISQIKRGANSFAFTIQAKKVLEDTKIGDSICTNGACLTVTDIQKSRFTVDVMSETVNKTNFADLVMGSKVNLERALKLSDRMGGHMVSGHIDGFGQIISINKDDIAWRIKIEANPSIIRQMLDKGSVAIDGISLTITQIFEQSFEVSIIPHTALETTLLHKTTNDKVNLETDIIGKYVERFLSQKKENKTTESTLDMNFLQKNGFI